MNSRRFLLILYLIIPAIVQGSNDADTSLHRYGDNRNAWLVYAGDHKFSDKFGIHLEVQLRRWNIVEHPQQLLLRTGINYHLMPNVFFTAGYCFVHTSPYGVYPVAAGFPEHRFWEQVQAKSAFGKVEWTGRLRIEQRFSHPPVLDENSNSYEPGDAVYTNRFRILNRLSLPLNGKAIADRSFYLTVSDEVFINSGREVDANIFDQNRAYIALGYVIPKLGRLELGYLEQTIFKSDGIRIERNHTIQLGLTSTLDFRRTKPKP